MKRLKGFSVMILFSVALFFISNVYSHNNSAPNFECIVCHEGEILPDIVRIQGIPKSYIPGKEYTLTVTVTSDLKTEGDVSGGFAVEVSMGKLIVIDKKNTQLSNSILTHTQEGSKHRKWTFGWKAPDKKTEISISVMALAANGDYSPAGDQVGAMTYNILPAK